MAEYVLSKHALLELGRVFAASTAPESLVSALSLALARYSDGASRLHRLRPLWHQRWLAASKVEKAARALREAIGMANTVFEGAGHDKVNRHWAALSPALDGLLRDLTSDVKEGEPPKRGRGQPHASRDELARLTFSAAQKHCRIPVNSYRDGKLFRIWAVVSREADRIDGEPPAKLSAINSTTWRKLITTAAPTFIDTYPFLNGDGPSAQMMLRIRGVKKRVRRPHCKENRLLG